MHYIRRKIIAMIIFCNLSCLCLAEDISPYLGQKPPGMKPVAFAPGIVSLPERCEVGGFFSPDMNEFYFTETDGRWTWTKILMTTSENGIWNAPFYAPFFSTNDSLCKFMPFDSQTMYFFRFGDDSQSDVWKISRLESGWGQYERLPAPINSNTAEWGFTQASDGTIYISSRRSGNADIYRIQMLNGEYGPAEPMLVFNTGSEENGPYVSPDHDFLMYHSTKPGGFGAADLYVSLRQDDGGWSEPVNMGPMINTSIEQWDPKVSPDGKYMFYIHRTGWSSDNDKSDIYWVDIRAVLPDPNGSIQNLTTMRRFSSIQAAINFASDGDEVVLAPGIYYESINLTGKNIVVRSEDPNDPFYIGGTIIQGDPNEPVIVMSGNSYSCQIAGLTIRAGYVGIDGSKTNAIIRNCRVLDNICYGLELSKGSNLNLNHCLLTANDQAGINILPGSGRSPCIPVIENCIIVDNNDIGIIGGDPIIIDSIVDDYDF